VKNEIAVVSDGESPAAAPAAPLKRRGAGTSPHLRRGRFGLAMIAPMMLGFLLFSLVPIVLVFLLSLTNWQFVGTPKFIGVENYVTAFATPLFWTSLGTTCLYVLVNLPIQWVLSMGLALLLDRALPGSKIFRVLFLIPWVTTPIAIAAVWRWMLDPISGVVNGMLSVVGIPPVQWFSTQMALPSVALINIWQFSGYTTLLLLVGLQAIPTMYTEAAAIDGAGYWQTFWRIRVPQLRPTFVFVSVTGVIGSFQVFDTIYGLTQGGPGDSTRVFYYYIYEQVFSYSNVGYGSALCVVLFLILLVFTLIQFRAFSTDTND
jgi:ABC-type sugar transport system permease subunit